MCHRQLRARAATPGVPIPGLTRRDTARTRRATSPTCLGFPRDAGAHRSRSTAPRACAFAAPRSPLCLGVRSTPALPASHCRRHSRIRMFLCDDSAMLEAQEYTYASGAEDDLGAANAHARGAALRDRCAPASLGKPGHVGDVARLVRAVSRRVSPRIGTPGAGARAQLPVAHAWRRRLPRCVCRFWRNRSCPRPAPRFTGFASAWSASWRRKRKGARLQSRARRSSGRRERRPVSAAALRHQLSDLLLVDTTTRHLSRLAALGLLARDDAEVLRDGWEFLQRLSSRLRIVENRSISDLDEERGDSTCSPAASGTSPPNAIPGPAAPCSRTTGNTPARSAACTSASWVWRHHSRAGRAPRP